MNKSSVFKKVAVILCVAVILVGATVGGTLAWLVSSTDNVVNTFTVGDINIDLKESPLGSDGKLTYDAPTDENWSSWVKEVNNYKFIPGSNLPKNPYVKVEANSEACYLFVRVDLVNWPATENVVLDLSNTGWTVYQDFDVVGTSAIKSDSIYLYREVDTGSGNQYFPIINGNSITVKGDLTKAEVDAIKTALGSEQIKLVFKAAAIQQANMADVDAAWDNLPADFKN